MDLTNLKVDELLKLSSSITEKLNEIFKSDIMGWYSIKYEPNSVWWYEDDSVGYTDLVGDEDNMRFDEYQTLWRAEQKDTQYEFEIYGTSMWEIDDLTAFVGDDGSGNRDVYIFKNNLKLTVG